MPGSRERLPVWSFGGRQVLSTATQLSPYLRASHVAAAMLLFKAQSAMLSLLGLARLEMEPPGHSRDFQWKACFTLLITKQSILATYSAMYAERNDESRMKVEVLARYFTRNNSGGSASR